MHDALERIEDMHMVLTTTTTVGSGGPTSGAAAWDDDDLLAELAFLTMADDNKDPKTGTTGCEQQQQEDEDELVVVLESPAMYAIRSDPRTATDTASHRTLPTTDTQPLWFRPHSSSTTVGGRVHFRRVMSPNTRIGGGIVRAMNRRWLVEG